MNTALELDTRAAARARAWRAAMLSACCDVVETWDHGTIFRAPQYPSYYDLNIVRVEEGATPSVEDLVAEADRALGGLGGLGHRLIEFDDAAAARPLRADFERRGWRSLRLLWMLSAVPPAPGAGAEVDEVPYDAVHDLRVHWYLEDFPGRDPGAFHAEAREVALRRDVRVLAAHEGGTPVAFAQLEYHGQDAEITEVYVRRDCRGRGVGTAVTRAAIAAAGPVRDLWIVADDEDRAKHLYRRLGFRGVAKTMQFLRLLG